MIMTYQKFKAFIFTEDVEKLITFYTETLGFKILKKLELPKDYGYTVEVAPGYEIWLANHSEIHGQNKESLRTMLNIYVDSVQDVAVKVKNDPRTEIVADIFAMNEFVPGETRYALTILDPDKNCLQFMGPL